VQKLNEHAHSNAAKASKGLSVFPDQCDARATRLLQMIFDSAPPSIQPLAQWAEEGLGPRKSSMHIGDLEGDEVGETTRCVLRLAYESAACQGDPQPFESPESAAAN